ncbi:MAG: UxaA family hydrolase, partial [Bacteroidota bacterium]
MKRNVLKVHPKDNVLVALQNLSKGQVIVYNGVEYTLQNNIGAKHKFFETDMHAGDEIIMYGVMVGKAQHEIPRGGLMTAENTKHASYPFAYRPFQYSWHPPDTSAFTGRTFNGYRRKDGRVGTANYWLFIPTVFCENRNL